MLYKRVIEGVPEASCFQVPEDKRKSNIAKGQFQGTSLTKAFEAQMSQVPNFIVEVIV